MKIVLAIITTSLIGYLIYQYKYKPFEKVKKEEEKEENEENEDDQLSDDNGIEFEYET